MIYLAEFEGKQIEFRCNDGKYHMTINVVPFLQNQTLVKIKKLVNLIRESDNPESVEVLKDYCSKWLQQYEPEQKINANGHVNCKESAKTCERELEKLVSARSRCKRKSEQYEHFNELVKKKRQEMQSNKNKASAYLSSFKENERVKTQYEKVINYIS